MSGIGAGSADAPRPMPRPRARLSRAGSFATVAIIAGVYFTAAKLGLTLAFVHPSATPIWPPTGIALAALLVLGYRAGAGVFLGAFLANLTTYGTVWTSLGIASGNTLEALIGTYLVNRYANGRDVFNHPRDIFRFALLGATISTIVSATTGVTSLALGGFAAWSDYPSIWLTWWLGDATGALIFTPLLVLWAKDPRGRWGGQKPLEHILFLLAFLSVSGVVFSGLFPFTYLTVPFLVWAAFRFDERETAAVIVLLTVIAVSATVRELGPFAGATPNASLLSLQAFTSIMAMFALPLASIVAERRAADREAIAEFYNAKWTAGDLHLQLRHQNALLEYRVRERTQELEDAYLETLERLTAAAELRDEYTGQHTRRVGELSEALARNLGLPADQATLIRRAATLHDVGKIGIADQILLKRGPLSPEEIDVMKTHAAVGARILTGGRSPLMTLAEEIALTHHERWDGSGYPRGLKGEAIPLAGRIVAVADAFDALLSHRPYREALPMEEAIGLITAGAGAHFDPMVVDALLVHFRRAPVDRAVRAGQP